MASALLRGAAGGGCTGPRSRHFVGMSQAVWPFSVSNMCRFRSRFGGCLRRFAGFSTLRGAAGGYCTGPRSRHFVGMSQAVWQFSGPASLAFGADLEDVSGDSLASAPPKGAAGGYLTGPVRAQFVGMSQAVCLFGGPTSFAFGADFEDVSSDSLVSALPRGAAGGISWARSGPDCGDVSGGLPVLGPNILRFRSSF